MQLRILGGALQGRDLVRLPGDVRPTQGRIRRAIFDALGPTIRGARVLDLFAGSGALGLEALSRGAATVVLVERNRTLSRRLRELVRAWEVADRVRVVAADVYRWLPRDEGMYDLVFADPPYAEDRMERLMGLLRPRVPEGGRLVLERARRHPGGSAPGWRLEREKTYGDTWVGFYRRVSGDL